MELSSSTAIWQEAGPKSPRKRTPCSRCWEKHQTTTVRQYQQEWGNRAQGSVSAGGNLAWYRIENVDSQVKHLADIVEA